MKFLFKTLGILLVILLALKVIIYLFDDGHKVSYSVGNFKVTEELKTDSLFGTDDYYFELKHEKFKMNFQVPVNYNKKEKIITSIKYEKVDDMKCIMPIFKGGKTYTDIMCLDVNGEINLYHNLGEDIKKSLSKFVSSLSKFGYNSKNYLDKAKVNRLSNTLSIYEDNMMENHYIAMENYKGLRLFSHKESSVKLFDNDIYKKPIKIFGDKYYIVADYNEEYSFKIFYVVNIINGNVKEIRSYNDISFDSVIQGYVGDDVYLFDKDAETQYKISLKHESVEKVAGKNNIKYYNGKWGTMTFNEAIEGKKFDNHYSKAPKGYDGAVCPGKETGYCYYYKKQSNDDGDEYLVYRADVQNTKLKTYIFKTSSIESIIYLNNYVYFRSGNSIYYYHDNGVRKVITNSEFEFNDDLEFGVYIK